MEDLKCLQTQKNARWSKVCTLYFSGRFSQALSLLKQDYPNLMSNPLSTILPNIKDASSRTRYRTLNTVAEVLYWCLKYNEALQIYCYMIENDISDERLRKADCYHRLYNYNAAVDILSSIEDKTSDEYFSLGQAFKRLGRFEDAEKNLVRALQLACENVPVNIVTDYYGNPIKAGTGENAAIPASVSKVNAADMSPYKRPTSIQDVTANVIACLISLGDVYSDMGMHTRATAYYQKSIESIHRLYGKGAVVPAAGHAFNNLGINYATVGKKKEAEHCYNRKQANSTKLSLKIANSYNQALTVYKDLSKSNPSLDTAETLVNLGFLYKFKWRNKKKAWDKLNEALVIYQQIEPDHHRVSCITSHLEEMDSTSGLAYRSRDHSNRPTSVMVRSNVSAQKLEKFNSRNIKKGCVIC